ncbi:amidohydrolase [Luteimonas soli]|uniref:Amidohydrolase n=1 Tax=Luteimonas soli TaxID=1648966 RepID=A0ABV7XF78_9GAMM
MLRLLGCALLLASAPALAIDLVLHNGKVWTGDPTRPTASAVAIDDGRITAVGNDADILALADAGARRIDLAGRRVVPGINDAHVHLGAWWQSSYLALPSPDPDRAELEDALGAQPKDGDGWLSASIGAKVLEDPGFTIASLDALQPTRPVILMAMTGHGTMVNSAARRALGIDPGAPVPGGWYGKDADGNFDGRLYEYAQWRMRATQPPLPDAAEVTAIQAHAREALEAGTTSLQVMTMLPAERFVALWQQSGMPQRLRLIRLPIPAAFGDPVDGAGLPREVAGSPRIRVSGTKWILDGTPLEHGAALRSPYPGTNTSGHLNFDEPQIEQLLREIIARDDQPLLHVSGDATAAAVLDAMAAVAPAEAWRKRRLRMEHGDGLRGDLVARARDYGVVVVQNPSHFALAPNAFIAGNLLSGFLDAGIPLALGSDGPPNPWLNMMWAVQVPYGSPRQALDREQVLRAYTAGSAYAEFAEDTKGRLAPGYVADLAVLSQDVLDDAVPVEALPATTSLLTVIDGEIAWRDPAFGTETAETAAAR